MTTCPSYRRWKFLAALVALAGLVGCEALDGAAEAEVEGLRAENEKLTAQVKDLQGEIAGLHAAIERSSVDKLREYLGANFDKRVVLNDSGQVTRVDLSDIEFQNHDLGIFQALPKLERLTLWGAGINDSGMDDVAKLTQISHLTLFNTELTSEGLAKLKPLAGNLAALNLRRSTYLSDDGLASLVSFNKLVQLELLYNNFTDQAMTHVAQLKGLKVLDLRGCVVITDSGMEKLQDLKQLRSLKLRNAAMTNRAFEVIGGFPELRELYIQDLSFDDEGVKSLANLRKLESLTIFGAYSMTDDSLVNLKDMTGMKSLMLRDIRLNGSGFANFKGMSNLVDLNISETDTNNDGAAHLAGLKSLEALDLWLTKINDEGLAKLEGLANLKTLNLAQTKTTDAGLASVAKLSKLESLDLQETPITDEGLPHLYALKNLKSLSLANTPVSDEAVAALKAALPQLADLKR